MDARSALFDLYGDHLRGRVDEHRGQAPVAALVRLLAPLGIAAPAVRTAVSRMVRQGWLTAIRLPGGPGYALTPKAVRRLDEAAERIYRTSQSPWDGRWHLVVLGPATERALRDRLHAQLTFLGYGPLGGSTWISPRAAPELAQTLAELGARAERFAARHEGSGASLLHRAWDLDALAGAYARFRLDASAGLAEADVSCDQGAFAARSRLVHAWRKFLFLDPGLPGELLPADWPGHGAAAWFDEQSARLLPAARRHVDACLSAEG